MRSERKMWQARLITAVTTLALVFASVMGTYGHAAGHNHHSVLHGAHGESFDHDPAPGNAQPAHIDCDHQHTDTGKGHTDCDDTICHGGYAILGGPVVTPLLEQSAPSIVSTPAAIGTRPGSLDRPPRSPVLAA